MAPTLTAGIAVSQSILTSRYSSKSVNVRDKVGHYAHVSPPLLAIVSAADVQFVHLVLEGCSFQPEALRRSALTSYLPRGS